MNAELINTDDKTAFIAQVTLLFEAAPPLADHLFAHRPYKTAWELIATAESAVLASLPSAGSPSAQIFSDRDLLAIINAHPRLGASQTEMSETSQREQGLMGGPESTSGNSGLTEEAGKVAAELMRLNAAYESKFGFRFVEFVNGRSRKELIPVLEKRLAEGTKETEMRTAVKAMMDIARDRLTKKMADMNMFTKRYLRGYGEETPNPKWPNNARIAISFVVNYEEGGENTPINGDKGSEVYLNETPGGVPKECRDMNMETQYEYGSRAGVWRLLRLFKAKNMKFTCYAVGRAVELNPEPIKAMVRDGHEIASHNYRWIDYTTLTEEQERDYVHRCVKAIKDAAGKPPVGWYTGRVSEKTRQIVFDEFKKMGIELLYDCDAYNDELPYYIDIPSGGKHLVVPYTLDCNDMKFGVAPGFSAPSGFYEYLKNTFDVLYEEGATHPKFMNVGLHCRLVGKPARAAALKQFLDYISQFEGVWVCTREELARHWKEQYP